ncbi:MAG: LysR family transcriptional regulator [Sphingopyxis sp.]|nr:LysR family transcriptional regulator [Sphingopyxis sp.]
MLDSRLSHVVAVSRAGSFTAAAGIAGVTQSAITRSIADLERQIGYAIFIRTSRGAILTEQGRDFAERARKLLDDTEELLQRPKGREDAYAGVLRIGICPASMEFHLIEPLAELLRRHPAIRLDVSGATFERTVEKLRNGSIDIAVGFEAAFLDWPDLRRQPVASAFRTALFVRRGHPLLDIENPGASDIAKYDFVSPSASRPYAVQIRALYEDRGIDWRKHIHVIDFFPMVKRIVATTDAIGVAVVETAEHSESFQSRFEMIDAKLVFPTGSEMCCAIRARWEARPAVRALMSILRAGGAADFRFD